MNTRITSIVTIVVAVSTPLAAFAKNAADVIVYGSTPGGFCAAIAAAREGAAVILLEPTEHIGGLSTGGLSHCDSNQMVRETLLGLFDEWHRRVVQDYTDRGLAAPYNPQLKDQARWTFEPHVAMRVTKQMLQESGVTVLTGHYLSKVNKEGPRITSLVTKQGEFTARVFVDGTYEGDLMAAAGVDWTIGREGRAEFGESYAGKQYPKPKMKISGFDERGQLLPLVTTQDAGADEAGDKNVMTYSFRLCLTKDPANLVPMPKPAKYDPARFELARRALQAGARVGFDLYPLPGNKLDGNNSIGGQISLGLIGGGNNWHNADEAGRQKIWEDHKQYTLELIHFLRTDPAVPPRIRNQFADLGLCQDEFASTDHFSPALYVRESRRMRGMYVISQKDIIDLPQKDDPIAISSFPIDSHDCQRVALPGGGVINEGTIFPVRVKGTGVGYAYHVPYRSILPKPNQCTNLLVPVALSCTHVGISSLRIEGAWMAIGQGAGVAAALAAKQNVAVQELPYPSLRERLLAQGQVLVLPAAAPKPKSKPNIVFVLFDDLGYGQPKCYRDASEFNMPRFDQLAEEGLRFTDAHSASAVCTPTRYGVLTGRCPSRIGQYGVLTTYSPPIIPKSRLTVASLLKQHGYQTACIGKWHLGMNWEGKPGKEGSIPVGSRIVSGPNDVGFDYFYGFTHARNIGTIIEQDRVVENVAEVENQPRMIAKAVEWLEQRKPDTPFFLYFPMCPPHTPVAPAPEFIGKSGAKDVVKNDPKYGDWVYQGDHMLGQLLDTLKRKGLAENTLVIATADNGAAGRPYHPLRASKASIYEGGHRVPFVAHWPGKIKPGTVYHETVCLNDLLATCAEIVGAKLPDNAGEDSVSLLPALLGTATAPLREATIHQSMAGDLAIRQGPWKLLFLKNGQRELYNLETDLSETSNVAAANPDVVDRLTTLMKKYITDGRSTAGVPQPNEKPISLDGRSGGKTNKQQRPNKKRQGKQAAK